MIHALISLRSSMLSCALGAALALSAPLASAATFLGFNAGPFYALVGSVNMPTAPSPLLVLFDAPVLFDTFVSISSSDPAALLPNLGGTTVPAGQSTAQVMLAAFSLGDFELTGSLGGVVSAATVHVVDTIPSVPLPPTAWMLAAGLGLLGLNRRRLG